MSPKFYFIFVFSFICISIIAFKIANDLLSIFFPIIFDEVYFRNTLSFLFSTITALAISAEAVNIALYITRIKSHIGKPTLGLTIFLFSTILMLFIFEN